MRIADMPEGTWQAGAACGDVRLTRVTGDAVARRPVREGAVALPACSGVCLLEYGLCFDTPSREPLQWRSASGDALLLDSSLLFLRPRVRPDQPLQVGFEGPFVSGLRGHDRRQFTMGELREASFTAIGSWTTASREVMGMPVSWAAPASPSDSQHDESQDTHAAPDYGAWVWPALQAVTPLWGSAPAEALRLFVAPVGPGDEVVFGEVRGLTGPSIVLFVGKAFDPRAHGAEDWVLVHELLHLGAPSFPPGEGRWFSEGLSTYYEPLVRARAGWVSAAHVFAQWRSLMQDADGVRLGQDGGVRAVYWGGAAFWLHVDMRIRGASDGRKSLDDVMRGFVARGLTTERVVSEMDAVAAADVSLGMSIVGDAYARYGTGREPLPVKRWLAELGVLEDPPRTDSVEHTPPKATRRADPHLREQLLHPRP
jgi:hypothetical protein